MQIGCVLWPARETQWFAVSSGSQRLFYLAYLVAQQDNQVFTLSVVIEPGSQPKPPGSDVRINLGSR